MFVWSADCSLKLRAFGAIPPSLTAGPLPLTMAAGGHGFQAIVPADITYKYNYL